LFFPSVSFHSLPSDCWPAYWLCDVIIDEEYRGNGLGKKLIEIITGMEELKGMSGILATRDAYKLYEKYGFVSAPENRFMRRYS
jgi:GNAT superfamily N-acetyltransferase